MKSPHWSNRLQHTFKDEKGEWLKDKVLAEIKKRMCDGTESCSLGEALALTGGTSGGGMPRANTIKAWARLNGGEDAAAIIKAEEARYADQLIGEIMDIADAPVENAVDVSHAKLRVDSRFKVAALLDPGKFSPKVQVSGSVEIGLSVALQEAQERLRLHRQQEQVTIEGEQVLRPEDI
jgi:hypothetical protein